MQFLPILLLLAAFVGMQVMGRRRRVETQRALLAQLAPGDEVMTSGGLIGQIVEVHDQEVLVSFAPGVLVRVATAAIIGRPPSRSAQSDEQGSGADAPAPHEDGT